jgi:hypothetical protein
MAILSIAPVKGCSGDTGTVLLAPIKDTLIYKK